MAIFTIKRNVSLKRFLCPDDTSGLTIIGENGAHRFVIHSLDAPFDGIVTAYFVRSDGTTVFMEGEIVGGMAVVVLHEDCYHVTGKFDISIFITKDGKSTCVYKGKGKVVQYRTDTVEKREKGEKSVKFEIRGRLTTAISISLRSPAVMRSLRLSSSSMSTCIYGTTPAQGTFTRS